MSKELNTKGKFFLREERDKECYGSLYLSEGLITLDLLEGLTDLTLKADKVRRIYRTDNKPEYEKVFGITNLGAVALIKRHFGKSQNWNYLTETSEKFSIGFIGEEDFSDTGEISFSELQLSYAGLKTFLGKSNITQKYQTKKDADGKEKMQEIEISASLKEPVLLKFSTKDYDISFEAFYSWSAISDDPVVNKNSIEETPIVRIRKKKGKMDIEEVRLVTFAIRDFLALALREKTYLTESYGFNEDSEGKRLKSEIFYSQYKSEDSEPPHYYMPLLSVYDIESEIGTIFESWISAHKRNPTLYHNYFKFMFSVSKYWESSFLALILGIESYIDLNIKENILDEKRTEIKEEDLLQALDLIKEIPDAKLRKYLKDRTSAFVNEVGFQRKFKSFYTYLPDGLAEKIDLQKDMKLISKVRNAIAHGGVTAKLQKEVEQNLILTKLILLSEYCLLETTSCKKETIDLLMKKMHPY